MEGDRAEVFVRDRGPGFDLARDPADRRGLRESVLGRMERHGGRAEIHTRPGEGTEVELVMGLMTALPRVVLVDDHGLFRAGVRAELDGLVDVVGDAGTVGEAIELHRRRRSPTSCCSTCRCPTAAAPR